MKRLIKLFLFLLPNSPVKVDGFCPKCGYPVAAKFLGRKIYFVCKNPLCDYYSGGFDIPEEISDNNFIIDSDEKDSDSEKD